MNTQKIISLIKAICARIQEFEGYLNKTKLLKILYLIDIEYYKKHKNIYTGFNWIFYDYGPWAYEYNDIYDKIKASPDFKITEKKVPKNINFITCISDKKEVSEVFERPGDSMVIKRLIDQWALKDLNEILNYVYFYTEPMIGIKRREKLDFSNINRLEKIPEFKLKKSKLSLQKMKKLRIELKDKLSKTRKSPLKQVVKPKYDDVYWEEIEKLDYDTEY